MKLIGEDQFEELILQQTPILDVRAPLEFDRDHVDPAFACVELGIHLFDRYHFRPYDEKALTVLMNQLYKYTPVFKAYHVEEHSRTAVPEPSSPRAGLTVH